MIIFTREVLGLSESIPIDIFPLEGRGSNRTFYRLKWHQETAILIHYDPKRLENTLYADIAAFLRDIGIPAPRLIRHDPACCLVIMEDLGDMDLWSLRKMPWETRRSLYQKTLAIAHRLHSFPEKDFPSSRLKLMEGFGHDLYRWEQNYFMDHFVRDICGIELGFSPKGELEAELSALAQRLAATTSCLVHRDLQSQNVMIRDGEPFLIDFQGMRFGSLFYDLGSLLYDPYVNFSDCERNDLLSFYYGLWRTRGGDLDWSLFQHLFWEASVQRLMQALGAYGFLGHEKGLKAFLEHIPAGLRNLHHAASQVASVPRLLDLSVACQRVIAEKDYSRKNTKE
jgi:aminoglycoside/choline kinase family phosphotransferase